MANVALPDVRELDGVIADYFDTLFPDMRATIERESIIERCIEPFTQLVAIWERVNAHGPMEKQLWKTFVRDLSLMGELPAPSKAGIGGDYRNATSMRKRSAETRNYRHYTDPETKSGEVRSNSFTKSNSSDYAFSLRFQINQL